MNFMSHYFKKKNNNAVWNNTYHQIKRKRDNVDVAVKRLKLVLVEPDKNKTEDDEVKVINKDVNVEKSSKVFPSFQLKNVTFMSKNLGACLCQCSEDGISIFLEDVLTEDGSIVLKLSELETVEMKPLKVILKVKETKIKNLKKIFQLEPWNHNNCTDGVSSKILQLNASEQESVDLVEQFYRHINKNLKGPHHTSDANPKSDENLKSDDGFCEEVSSEIDVKSFYGTSKAKTKERKIEEGPSRNPHSTRSRKECPKCGVATTTGRFRRNRKCHGCEENDEKCARKESEDLCNSPTSDPKRLFEYPPPPSVGRITFTNHDRACLETGELFNDVNIDFYLKFFHQEVLSKEDRERTHIFSSFFYSHLTSDPTKVKPINKVKSRHQRVRNWTRNVDIFSKDFVIVPINQKCHWFLAIICFPGLCGKPNEAIERCCLEDHDDDEDFFKSRVDSRRRTSPNQSGLDWIAGYDSSSDENPQKQNTKLKVDQKSEVVKSPVILIFDSLSGGNPKSDVSTTLRQYLQVEWNVKKNSTNGEKLFSSKVLRGCSPSCPQQSNHYDCGPYLLLYVQHFFMSPILNFNPPIKKLQNWFSKGDADMFRRDLQTLVDSLTGKHPETAEDNHSVDACNGEVNGEIVIS